MALAALLAAACGDVRETTYVDFGAARRAGAVERGWVPDVVPPAATAIRERHNLDTNEFAGTFRFPPMAADSLRRLEVHVGPVSGPRLPPAWLPEALRGDLVEGGVRAAGFEIARGRGDTVFAIDWANGECFYWSHPR